MIQPTHSVKIGASPSLKLMNTKTKTSYCRDVFGEFNRHWNVQIVFSGTKVGLELLCLMENHEWIAAASPWGRGSRLEMLPSPGLWLANAPNPLFWLVNDPVVAMAGWVIFHADWIVNKLNSFNRIFQMTFQYEFSDGNFIFVKIYR